MSTTFSRGLPFAESLILLKEKAHGPIEPIFGVVGTVRRNEDIFKVVDGVARRDRLLLEDIETRAPDFPAVERANKSRLIDDRAAADVDDNRARLHRRKCRITDHVMGFRRERRGDHDIVAKPSIVDKIVWTVEGSDKRVR